MARLVKPLMATQVQNTKPKESMYKLFDGGGLFLQVTPAGGKHWKLKYRRDDGKEGLLSFGAYPDVSLEQARKKRDEARTQKAAGIDPAEAKRREKLERTDRAKNTFEAVALEWMEVHGSKVAEKSLQSYQRVLERYAFPLLGKMPVNSLRSPDFLEVLRCVEATGHLVSMKFLYTACSLIMRFAAATGRADFDPLPALRGSLKRHKPKHFAAITEPEEVGRILRVLWQYRGTYVITAALKISPYIFVRPGELRKAKWEEIDFDACEWRYHVTKTNIPHIVPLAPQVMSILKELHPLTCHKEYVFPSLREARKPMSHSAIVCALRGAGIGAEELTAHGFRAVARTLLDEVLGERYDLIEHQLAHTVRDPNGRAYNRTQHLPERHRMMRRWATYLDSLRAGKDEIPPFEVGT